MDAEAELVALFCAEIGRDCTAVEATFGAVAAVLDAELVLPLRALNEGTTSMTTTFSGHPVPREQVEALASSHLAYLPN